MSYVFISISGETPVKRDFKTNINLAKTPHDELKRKFQEKFAQVNGDDLNADCSFLGER